MAKADPLGMACPLAAHIRKVNPRDGASDVGSEGANHRHRILRSGVPFGPRRTELKADPVANEAERGQLFLCIQASIEEQFEFLQARWMNDDRRPRSPGGHDMISGRMPSTDDGVRRCSIFGAEGQEEDVRADERFITSSGGAYFFVPSLCAIRDVLAAQ
jgi:deferrochelatase/peroxidase EfeB